jgi:hypothetical protein
MAETWEGPGRSAPRRGHHKVIAWGTRKEQLPQTRPAGKPLGSSASNDSNTLKGFLDLELAGFGMVLKGCTFHEREGKRWIGFPGKLYKAFAEAAKPSSGSGDALGCLTL